MMKTTKESLVERALLESAAPPKTNVEAVVLGFSYRMASSVVIGYS